MGQQEETFKKPLMPVLKSKLCPFDDFLMPQTSKSKGFAQLRPLDYTLLLQRKGDVWLNFILSIVVRC